MLYRRVSQDWREGIGYLDRASSCGRVGSMKRWRPRCGELTTAGRRCRYRWEPAEAELWLRCHQSETGWVCPCHAGFTHATPTPDPQSGPARAAAKRRIAEIDARRVRGKPLCLGRTEYADGSVEVSTASGTIREEKS